MSFRWRAVAHCDVCGHEWLRSTGKNPSHCAKCKSRRWNKDDVCGGLPTWGDGSPGQSETKPAHIGSKRKHYEHAPTCKCMMCKPERQKASKQ